MKVTFEIHFGGMNEASEPRNHRGRIGRNNCMGKLNRAEEKSGVSVKREPSICLGLIHLYNVKISDPHNGDDFASRVCFHSICFVRRSKPITVNLGVYSTYFPRVPGLANMILLRVEKSTSINIMERPFNLREL